MDAQDVIYAAQKIAPLLDEARRQTVESLLARAAHGEKVDNFLIDELRQDPHIRRWLRDALGLSKEVTLAYDPLPGNIGSVTAPVYVCPHGDFEWEIRRVGQPIPPCPVHNEPLVPKEKKDSEK